MKNKVKIIGPCSTHVANQGWTTEVSAKELKSANLITAQEMFDLCCKLELVDQVKEYLLKNYNITVPIDELQCKYYHSGTCWAAKGAPTCSCRGFKDECTEYVRTKNLYANTRSKQ